ncbi:MAG TPA: GAD-like domain-containing protein, partial [Cellvibrio sp.]|nr:GAD-like domain-containing protein [Cellvibrio sp.]
EPQNSVSVTKNVLSKYKGILPNRLLEYWQEYGFCGFKNGLFWIVNPEEYTESINTWLKDTEVQNYDDFHVIARTGFGSLLLWGKRTGQSWRIDINDAQIFFKRSDEKRIKKEGENTSLMGFFGVISPENINLEDVDTDAPLFEQAVNKFGPLNPDEMFTFEPALFLGGEQTLKTVNKVNFFIQSQILASMGQREIMDIKGLAKKAFGKKP